MATADFFPNGEGSTTELTPHPAAPNWACVDEPVSDDLSSFVHTPIGVAAVPYIDLYKFSPTAIGGKINSVTISVRSCSTSAYGGGVYMALRTYETNHFSTPVTTLPGTPYELMPTMVDASYTWILNPYTSSSWTWDEIYAMEIGNKLIGYYPVNGNAPALTTQLKLTIDYEPSAVEGGVMAWW